MQRYREIKSLVESYDDKDAALESLRQAADALHSDDLRRTDFQVTTALASPPSERIAMLETLLLVGKSGLEYTIDEIANHYLWTLRRDETERSDTGVGDVGCYLQTG